MTIIMIEDYNFIINENKIKNKHNKYDYFLYVFEKKVTSNLKILL